MDTPMGGGGGMGGGMGGAMGGGMAQVESAPKKEMSAEEAEMLAMLKGMSSSTHTPEADYAAPAGDAGGGAIGGGGGGGGMEEGGAEVVDDRPLEVRLVDSDWKTRKKAYADLAVAFKEGAPGGGKAGEAEAVFAPYAGLLAGIAGDINANAFAAAVDPLTLFISHAKHTPETRGVIEGQVVPQVLKNGLAHPKAPVVKKVKAMVVAVVETATVASEGGEPAEASAKDEEQDAAVKAVLGAVFEAAVAVGKDKTKTANANANAVSCATEVVAAFGALSLPFRFLVGKAVGLLESETKKVKDEAIKLIIEVRSTARAFTFIIK